MLAGQLAHTTALTATKKGCVVSVIHFTQPASRGSSSRQFIKELLAVVDA